MVRPNLLNVMSKSLSASLYESVSNSSCFSGRSVTSPSATTPSMLSSTKVILGTSFVARGIFVSWSTRSSLSVPGSSKHPLGMLL